MSEEERENIKEEIANLQHKLDTLVNKLEATEETPAPAVEEDQDVVQNEHIPVVYINPRFGQTD